MRTYPLTLFILIIATTGLSGQEGSFVSRLVQSTNDLTQHRVTYDPAYFSIPYPNGDVPPDKGVCTDVVIRAFRGVGIDLQRLVHEDMKAHFSAYPKIWGLRSTDKNIDHRRVPNLMAFFQRAGAALPISEAAKDYQPGDIVAWNLRGGITHIGMVIDQRSPDGERPLIVHNIGGGQVREDVLFAYRIIGHYRYRPSLPPPNTPRR